MKKKSFLVIFIILFSFFYCKKQIDHNKIKIAVTIYPLFDAIRNIANDTIQLSLIIPANSSPHTFEPLPETFKNITQAKIVFMIGLGLEVFMDKIKKQNPNIRYIEVGKMVNPEKFNIEIIKSQNLKHNEHEKDNHSHNDLEGFDPHVWLDPIKYIKIVEIIRDELININPVKKDLYKKNSDNYIKKLNELDIKIKNSLKHFKNKSIITFHNAFMYFCKRYGLKVAAVFEPWPGKDPGVLYRKRLVDIIKKMNVKAVFYEPQFNKSSILSLAKETNIKIGEIDPIGSPNMEKRRNYIELIEYNINSLRDALSD